VHTLVVCELKKEKKMNPKDKMPKEFYRGGLDSPTAKTVSELIAQLERLPGELRIGDYNGVELDVYNIKTTSPSLHFTEID